MGIFFDMLDLEMLDVPSMRVVGELYEIFDPEFEVNVVDLGLVRSVDVEGSTVRLEMTLTTPACPFDEVIESLARSRLARLGFDLDLTWSLLPPWSLEQASAEGRAQLSAIGL